MLLLWFILITANLAPSIQTDDSDIINPNWVKPGWRNNRQAEVPAPECKCPPVVERPTESSTMSPIAAEENDRLAWIYYRTFLLTLFEEDKLVVDESDASFMLRNVQFKINDRQLKRLKNAQTAREIVSVVDKIIEQSEAGVYQKIETMCCNFVAWYQRVMLNSFFLYIIVPVAALLLLLGVAKLLDIRLWILIPAIGIIITYVLTYRDCNNRLEMESLARLFRTDGSNPCSKHHRSRWLERIFLKDYEGECMEHIREQNGLKRSFCDPSEVFVEMVAKLHLQYFETFVIKMVSIFKTSTNSSGIVESALITVFILFILYLLITVGVKYGMYAGGQFLSDIMTKPRVADQTPTPGNVQRGWLPPPGGPFNISININRPRRLNSRVEQVNRIEEITEGGSAAIEAAKRTADHGNSQVKEGGSGDGLQVKSDASDADESLDQEMINVECNMVDDVREDANINVIENQHKK